MARLLSGEGNFSSGSYFGKYLVKLDIITQSSVAPRRHTRSCLSWSGKSSGFHWRVAHGNRRDRFLSIEC